jgi:hypothetical protein
VPHVEQELLTLPGYLNSSPIFRVVGVTRSLVLWLVFCRSMFVLFSYRIKGEPYGIFMDATYAHLI